MKVFLLDADVIIWCAENNKLDALFKNKRIKIPKVIYEQVKYIEDPETDERKTIQFDKYLEDKSLEIIDNPITDDIEDIRNTYKQCPEIAEIHSGEVECISLLKDRPNYSFCTGDKSAIRVLGYLQLSEQAISLEELIGRVRNIRYDFTKEYMKKYLKVGSDLWIKYGWDLE